MKKNAISPIIATVLLIVIALFLITMLIGWGRETTNSNLSNAKEIIHKTSEVNGYITVEKTIGNKIQLKNTHKTSEVKIVGYKILNNTISYDFLKENISLDTNIDLNPNSTATIEIACIPEKNFTLNLHTENNTYIEVNINNAQTTSCLEYGLIGWWDFTDVGSLTLTDKSGNSHTGTITGSTINEFWASGNYKGVFDGTDTKLDTGTDYIGTTAITLVIWVKPYSDGENYGGRIIDNDKFTIFYSDYPTVYTNQIVMFSNFPSSGCIKSTNDSISLNAWQFVSVTRTSAGIVNFYIGDLDTTPALSGSADQDSGTPLAGTTNVFIGNRSAEDRTFDGEIGDLRVYNRILTLTEIQDVYNKTKIRFA